MSDAAWRVSPSLVFILFSHLLPQIRSLRRERVETIAEKEELVDDPMENGTLHSPPDGFAEVLMNWFVMNSHHSKLSSAVNHSLSLWLHICFIKQRHEAPSYIDGLWLPSSGALKFLTAHYRILYWRMMKVKMIERKQDLII